MNSFKVLRENKQLIIFPILSGISMILILGSFVTFLFARAGWDIDGLDTPDNRLNIIPYFIYYFINYFVVVFFNMALVHCTHLYFRGEEVTIAKGLRFSMSRIGAIFAWALFAGTIGTILRVIEENSGWLGKILISIVGWTWSVATFFVVPVIAYENEGPFGALKRSTKMMGEKWGESLGATFSFGLVQFIAILLLCVPLFLIGMLVHVVLGIVLAILGVMLIMAVFSASQTIFVSAVYHNIAGDPVKHFNQQTIDNLFEKMIAK